MLKISFSAIIDGVNAKKDKTLSIRLGTQELSPDDSSHLLDLMGKQIFVAFGETDITEMEIPEVLPEMKGDKSPSQRMRGIIYKIWEKKTDKKEPFPRYYENYMFRVCELLKDKLN